MLIQSDIRLKIGKDVKFNAYGVKTNLEGELAINQDQDQLGIFGQVNLNEGKYRSFGQDLLIQKGKISFAGPPTQPLLDIEAIRNPVTMEQNNVTVGVKVTGIADKPEITIFSQPAMSHDQALIYLLTGRSIENNDSLASTSLLGSMLLSLGVVQGGKMLSEIGETVGIQDLNFGTKGSGQNSQLVVSGNIASKIQLKYGLDLFDGLTEFTIRYKLLPHLYLQSVSGINQSFDLLYQFEF